MRSLLVTSAVVFAAGTIFGQTYVLTYHNDNMRTGQNLSETVLTPQNVKSATFGKLFTLPVDGKVDAQPLLVSGLNVPNVGARNVVFVATEHDSLYAFDADTGAPYWQITLLKSGETTSDTRSCSQVTPEIGITGTPVVDLSAGPNGTIYAVAMSKDSAGGYHQRLHAVNLATGVEQFGGPVDIQATYPGAGDGSSGGTVTFDPKMYKARTGLLLANGVVYTSWGSHCDIRPYNGWTISYNELTLARTGVFNFAPNGEGAAVWGAGSGIAADSSGTLFFQLANGTFDTAVNGSGFPGNADYGNAFLKLSMPGATPTVLDYWTMYNTVSESNADEDLGSGGVMLIPDVSDGGGNTRHLGVGVGKDGDVYMFDRDSMGKFDSANNGNLYQEIASGLHGASYASPAWFNGTAYFGAVNDVIRAFPMTAAMLGTSPSSTSGSSFPFPGATPSISANGATNGILWAVQNSNPAVLHAYDATNLATELYNSNQVPSRDQFGNGNKFITPMIANGKVYVGTTNSVAVFGLNPVSAPTLTSVNPSSGTQGNAVNVTLTGTGFTTGASVAVSGSGVTVSNVVVGSATQITATFTIGSTAATGARNVTVGASNAVTFTVLAKTNGPTLTSINPTSGTQGTPVSVTLNGTGFISGATVSVSGSGVSVSGLRIANSTQITCTLTIAATAATGGRTVTVTTSAGTSNPLTFTVNAKPPSPTLSSISPSSGTRNTQVPVTLNGANFLAGATIQVSGSGVSVSNIAVVNAGQITARFNINGSGKTGTHTVTVTTTGGTSNGVSFTVQR